MEEHQQQQPSAEKNWFGRALLAAGAVLGAYLGARWGKKGMAIGGVLGWLSSLGVKSLTEDTPNLPPPAVSNPPSPPPQPPLALANIPQILDILVQQQSISPAQQQSVLDAIKTGRKGFAGDIAVADGFVSAELRDAALITQTLAKTEAAVVDIQRIRDYGAAPAPAWLKSNWGNNGVNPPANPATQADGISAAANCAQNLVMIANHIPQLAPAMLAGVVAAANLARGIAYGNSAQVPLAQKASEWQKTMQNSLILAQQSGVAPMDANGAPVAMQDFINARHSEIQQAVAQVLAQGHGHGHGHGQDKGGTHR